MTETKKRTEAIELIESYGGKLLEVHLTGKLEKADYEAFVPEFEQAIERQGKVRILVVMTAFHGWAAGLSAFGAGAAIVAIGAGLS